MSDELARVCHANRVVKVNLLPNRVERTLLRYWPVTICIIFSPLVFVPWFESGSFLEHLSTTMNWIGVGFVWTLFIAIVLGCVGVGYWETTFRETFGNAVDDGIIREDATCINDYVNLSVQLANLTGSPWRYVLWLCVVVFVGTVNRGPLSDVLDVLRHKEPIGQFFYQDMAILSIQFLLTYAGSAVIWSLFTTANWIAQFSKSSCLQLQPGHPDNCCGLGEVGLCTLRSVIPLLVGMVLFGIWGYGDHLQIFAISVNLNFVRFLRPYIFFLVATMFVLACALVFVPVTSLHKKMLAYKRLKDREFCSLVRDQCELSAQVFFVEDELRTKYLSDRLKLVQSFDPITLRLSTWPFDRRTLVTYGITPVVTLLASTIQELIKKHGATP